MRTRPLHLLLCALFSSGCASHATLWMRDGTSIEGHIVRSDEAWIYLKRPPGAAELTRPDKPPASECEARGGFCADEPCDPEEDEREAPEPLGCAQRCCLQAEPTDPQTGPRLGNPYERTVARDEIQDITHPGLTAGWLGTAFGIAGLGMLISGSTACRDTTPVNNSESFCKLGAMGTWIPGLLIATISIPLALDGWISWGLSRDAAALPAGASASSTGVAVSSASHAVRLLGLAPLLDSRHRPRGVGVLLQL